MVDNNVQKEVKLKSDEIDNTEIYKYIENAGGESVQKVKHTTSSGGKSEKLPVEVSKKEKMRLRNEKQNVRMANNLQLLRKHSDLEIPQPKDATQTDEKALLEDETPIEHPPNTHPTPTLPQAQAQATVPGRQSQQDLDQVQQTGHKTDHHHLQDPNLNHQNIDPHSTTVPEDQVLVTENLAEQEAQHVQPTQQVLVEEDLATQEVQHVQPKQQVLAEEDLAKQEVQHVQPTQQF